MLRLSLHSGVLYPEDRISVNTNKCQLVGIKTPSSSLVTFLVHFGLPHKFFSFFYLLAEIAISVLMDSSACITDLLLMKKYALHNGFFFSHILSYSLVDHTSWAKRETGKNPDYTFLNMITSENLDFKYISQWEFIFGVCAWIYNIIF